MTDASIDQRYYKLCALSEMKNVLRSGDIWVQGSRQLKDFEDYLVPPEKFDSTFKPRLISKGERQLNGFDKRIIYLYYNGLSVRDIQTHFQEVYGVEMSTTFISQVTNAVMEDIKAWQQRPLDPLYPIVYLDCIVIKSQESGAVINKSVYLALGINTLGEKELLGLWIAKNEGVKFWLSVITELKNRGVQDIFIACCDGLKSFPDAIEAVYPQTRVQLLHCLPGA